MPRLVHIVVLALACGCAPAEDGEAGAWESRLPIGGIATAEDPIEPIPERLPLDPRRAELGRRLFADRRLSGDGRRACVDCHDLARGGIVPGETQSDHPRNATGPYNVPTVFNVAFNFRYNWNGTFTTLEEHLAGPMMSERVMNAGSWPELVSRLRDPYRDDFVAAGYRDGVTEESIRDAMSTYQRSLITPNARFDLFLQGQDRLSAEEREGYRLFKRVGCVSCHQGINVGGNMFQRYGVMENPFGGRELVESDFGRMQVTGRQEDAYVFRVPSLRNVELTAPYFHDGSAATLEQAVTHMARVQLGYALTEEEVASIAAFLRTLTGERPR